MLPYTLYNGQFSYKRQWSSAMGTTILYTRCLNIYKIQLTKVQMSPYTEY